MVCLLVAYAGGLRATNYIFFLHNKFVEELPLTTAHPEYGICDYHGIVDGFKKSGAVVYSEIRPKNTDVKKYAAKVAHQVDSLLKKGVQASAITIVGTSKGGFIAQQACGMIKNKNINYVFVGCCDDDISSNPDVVYYGNILAIHEASDIWHSCRNMAAKPGTSMPHYKEILLHTGLKHGFLFQPRSEWMKPAILWSQGKYN